MPVASSQLASGAGSSKLDDGPVARDAEEDTMKTVEQMLEDKAHRLLSVAPDATRSS